MKNDSRNFFRHCYKLAAIAALVIGSSCGHTRFETKFQQTEIDPKTGQFPAWWTVPDSSILEYKPSDISRVGVVHVRAHTNREPQTEEAWRSYVITHTRKMGPWLVSDNINETAEACGRKEAESLSELGKGGCQFLLLEMYLFWIEGGGPPYYRVSITKYPEEDRVLQAQGECGLFGWGTSDTDIHRPLLNLVKRWLDQCVSASQQCSWQKSASISDDRRDFLVYTKRVGVVAKQWGLGSDTVKQLEAYGYPATLLPVDDDLFRLVEQYQAIRGEITAQPFLSVHGRFESLEPFSLAIPFMTRHGVDALVLVEGKHIVISGARAFLAHMRKGSTSYCQVDLAVLGKSGKLADYRRDELEGCPILTPLAPGGMVYSLIFSGE